MKVKRYPIEFCNDFEREIKKHEPVHNGYMLAVLRIRNNYIAGCISARQALRETEQTWKEYEDYLYAKEKGEIV